MVWWWWIPPAVVGLIGLVVAFGGLGWAFRGRPLNGVLGLAVGVALLAVAAAAALLGLDVLTYHRLTYERPVASIELHIKGPRLYEAVLSQPPGPGHPTGSAQTYPIHGDDWRIEARVLKWKPWANVLGLDSQYQLDRLSGRYEDTEAELHAERSVYDLRPAPSQRVDLWKLARRYGKRWPVVDTLYGSAAFMPMAEGAKYEVWITQSGLIARPANTVANQATATGWR